MMIKKMIIKNTIVKKRKLMLINIMLTMKKTITNKLNTIHLLTCHFMKVEIYIQNQKQA